MKKTALPPVAFIDEPNCIGCALCLKVCPTDAILGAARHLHTVIAADCTGCEKCLPVCPTDCIVLKPRAAVPEPAVVIAAHWRARTRARKARLAQEEQRRMDKLRQRARKPVA
jgi:Na+-translocating ferredoxin:NAD+ oxidoreductase subunit B